MKKMRIYHLVQTTFIHLYYSAMAVF